MQLEDFLFQAYTSARDNPSQPKVMDLNFSCQYQQEGYENWETFQVYGVIWYKLNSHC